MTDAHARVFPHLVARPRHGAAGGGGGRRTITGMVPSPEPCLRIRYSLRACERFEEGRARPQHQCNRKANVLACHHVIRIPIMSVSISRATPPPHCLLDKQLGARNELLNPTGRAWGDRPNTSHVVLVESPHNPTVPKRVSMIGDVDRISMADGALCSMIDPSMVMANRR